MFAKKRNGVVAGLLAVGCALPVAGAADWPEWGGGPSKNMISDETGLPESFEPGKKKPGGGGIDLATTEHVKWTAQLGTNAYGNPTVAQGRVYVGTDDYTVEDDPRFCRARGGLVKCLDEATGQLMWQLVIPERKHALPEGAHFGHQHLGVCSSPTVDGDQVYVIASSGDVVCLDANGLADGNDGPFQNEAQYMVGPDADPVELREKDADILWVYDMISELGVCPHDAASCSVLIHGDVLYTSTSNGVGAAHEKCVSPEAPSFLALDKRTGRLVAVDNEKIGRRMYHAQWSSPSKGEVGGRTLIFFGGGDGVCYAFEAITQVPSEPGYLKKVWWYDCNPPEYKFRDGKPIPYYAGDKRKKNSPNRNDGKYVGPSQIIATPVFHQGRIYVLLGQDPAHGRGKGMLHCVDASGTGDITQTGRIWTYDGLDRSISTVAVHHGLVYAADIAGRIHCVDADTGHAYWVHETGAETWGGPLVADGKLFFGTKRHFFVMAEGKQPRVLTRTYLGAPVYSTPIAANGTLYVTSQRYLWAVCLKP